MLHELVPGQIVISLRLMIYHHHLLMISLVLVHHLSLFILIRWQFFSGSRMLLVSCHQKRKVEMLSLSTLLIIFNSFLLSLFEEIMCNLLYLCFIYLFALCWDLRLIFLSHPSLAKIPKLEGQLSIILYLSLQNHLHQINQMLILCLSFVSHSIIVWKYLYFWIFSLFFNLSLFHSLVFKLILI